MNSKVKTNVTKVRLGTLNSIEVSALTQWDKGQMIEFIDRFADGTEVQFGTSASTSTINKIIENNKVEIPDAYLEGTATIYAWVKVITSDSETTVKEIRIPVKARTKPADYIAPDDEPTFREQMQEIMEQTEQIAQSVRDDAEAGKFDGKPGKDGKTPQKGVDYFTPTEVDQMAEEAASKVDVSGKADKKYVDDELKKKPTVFNKTPTSTPSDFPNIKYGDLCVSGGVVYTPKQINTDRMGNVIYIGWSQCATVTDLAEYVKTVNGQTPDEDGNVEIEVGGGDITAEEDSAYEGDIPLSVEDVYAELSEIKPENPPEDIGKILKVLSVNEDGTFTCEWADAPKPSNVKIDGVETVDNNIPIATDAVMGISKPFGANYGIKTFGAGNLVIAGATEAHIDGRVNSYAPITSRNLDYATKLAMCDGKGASWTADEQANARARLGIEKEWTHLIHSVDEEGRLVWEENNLDDVTEIMIVGTKLDSIHTTGNSGFSISINGKGLANSVVGIGKNGTPQWSYAIAKYNGLIWDIDSSYKGASATSVNCQASNKPCNLVFGIGKATSIKLNLASSYALNSGTLDVYVR